ncbi:MAG: hypothetical protein RBT70_10025 [Alphaproteobacteria bacterium]|jgi:hypothetical protein|nr:hypothetical protein [Alphaproteobacteria bacterium]
MTMKSTTPGPWIVAGTTLKTTDNGNASVYVVRADDQHKVVAIVGAKCPDDIGAAIGKTLANAALIAIAPDMIDCLIAIQQTLMSDKEVVNLEAMNEMISGVFAKLANEAGEEL